MADLEDELHDNALRPAEHGIGNARIVERSLREQIELDKHLKAGTQTVNEKIRNGLRRFKPGGTQ